MIEERDLPAPVMQAPGSLDCGLCATRYILNRFGLDADLEDLRVSCRFGQDGARGVASHNILRTLVVDFGFEQLWPNQTIELHGTLPHAIAGYRELLEAGWVALVNRRYVLSIGHYMVVDAVDDAGRLLVTCSLNGRRWWNSEEFFGGFDGQGDGRLWYMFRRKEGA